MWSCMEEESGRWWILNHNSLAGKGIDRISSSHSSSTPDVSCYHLIVGRLQVGLALGLKIMALHKVR